MSRRSRAGVRGLATAAVLALSLVPIGSLDLARADSLLQRGDPITQVSNRGTRVEAKTAKRAERERMPRELFLLRRDQGSAVYRIGGLRPGYTACYASGPGNEIGKLGSISCARSSFPSRGQPLFDLSLIQYHRGVKHPQLYRLQGVAADAIAAIGLADAAGHVLKRITVEQNVYLLAAPPSMATGVLVGYDRQGDVVYRSDRRAQSPAPPPAPNPRRLAPTRTPSGAPLQRGRTDDVAIAVYRSGVVALRFETSSRLYRQLQRKPLSVACLTFDSVNPWDTNESWGSKPLSATVLISLRGPPQPPYATLDPSKEPKPPFDGCLVGGSYGRRWNDTRGQHSPAEIAFTARGRRFFDERARARDLALFVRSGEIASLRRTIKRGESPPAATAIVRGLPSRVVALHDRDQLPALDEIGLWSDRTSIVEASARSTARKRLFIELRGGRIFRHNLDGLAFVF